MTSEPPDHVTCGRDIAICPDLNVCLKEIDQTA